MEQKPQSKALPKSKRSNTPIVAKKIPRPKWARDRADRFAIPDGAVCHSGPVRRSEPSTSKKSKPEDEQFKPEAEQVKPEAQRGAVEIVGNVDAKPWWKCAACAKRER